MILEILGVVKTLVHGTGETLGTTGILKALTLGRLGLVWILRVLILSTFGIFETFGILRALVYGKHETLGTVCRHEILGRFFLLGAMLVEDLTSSSIDGIDAYFL